MFDRVQVWAMAGPLKDIQPLVLKPLLRCLGLRVFRQTPSRLSGFRLANLPKRPDFCSAAEMVVLLEGSPISTEELELYQS